MQAGQPTLNFLFFKLPKRCPCPPATTPLSPFYTPLYYSSKLHSCKSAILFAIGEARGFLSAGGVCI